MSDTVIACPVCLNVGPPAAVIGGISICGACGASLVVTNGTVRRATAEDMAGIDLGDLQTLRRARGKIARAGR